MRLYDTFTRSVQELPPPPGPIRMYVCGPTVYARAHVGNARPFVIAMWLRSWLRSGGYHVELVHNITDINDKIYDAAPGRSAELAEQASRWYVEDTGDLGLGQPDHVPKATETIPEIVALIEELLERGLAYPADGDVYYRVSGFPDYGRLSGRLDGESVRNPSEEDDRSELKEDARDFALWKAHKEGEDTWWESPWGRGRPGWHIECSAMAEKFLGPVFEIHGGGLDLIFPHHENEVAQSRGAGREFARLWMHNGMLQFVGEKMSKSLGNVVTLREALDTWGRETLLVYFLGGHWRKPLDFSDDALEQASAQWQGFRDARRRELTTPPDPVREWDQFGDALNDDFNTPQALAVMHDWLSNGYLELLDRGLDVFGLRVDELAADSQEVRAEGIPSEEAFGRPTITQFQYLGNRPPEEVMRWARERHEARERGDFGVADSRRAEIERAGFKIDDIPNGYVITRLSRERHPKR